MGESALYLGLPPRKLAELFGALFALYLGAWGLLAWTDGHAIFWWSEGGRRFSLHVSLFLTVSALVHGLGVKINGNWRWSPALRMVGMSGHLSVMLWLAIDSALAPTWTAATPGYSAWSVLFFVGWLATLRDLVRAIEGKRQEWTL